MAAALRAALIDVGGTLWPDGWHPAWDEGDPLREERLRAVLPASAPVAELLSELKPAQRKTWPMWNGTQPPRRAPTE